MEERESVYLLTVLFIVAFTATLTGGIFITKTAIERGVPSDAILSPFRTFSAGAMIQAGLFFFVATLAKKKLGKATIGDLFFLAASLVLFVAGLWILAQGFLG